MQNKQGGVPGITVDWLEKNEKISVAGEAILDMRVYSGNKLTFSGTI